MITTHLVAVLIVIGGRSGLGDWEMEIQQGNLRNRMRSRQVQPQKLPHGQSIHTQ